MSMTPWNGNIEQALKWMHSNAPNIRMLIQQKAAWMQNYHTAFWDSWKTSVLDLRTAGPFGLMVWCIILGVPSQLFGLQSAANAWAYGPERQNYKYSGADPSLPVEKQSPGGNFYGGGNTTLLNLDEVRWALMLRYAALVGNGRIEYINRILAFIFNGGEPWDASTGRWFYVMDCTSALNNTITIDALYKTDWQGKQLQYSTARTNICTYSEQLDNAAWSKNSTTITVNAIAAPDGTTTMDKIVEAATQATHACQRSITAAPSTTYTVSIFLKAGERRYGRLRVGSNIGYISDVRFDLVTGKYINSSGAPIGDLPSLGNGIYRASITVTTQAGTTQLAGTGVYMFDLPTGGSGGGDSYLGDGTSGLYAWGMDVKQSATLSSYIPTTSATVTRTDYTQSGADLTMAVAPVVGAELTWTGHYGIKPVVDQLIGVGDGSDTTFTIPANGSPTAVPAPFNLQYQVGPEMGLSAQFINLLNDAKYGIMPSAAGSKVIVNQET